MKITLKERTASTLEEILSPEDNMVFRCLGCQEYFLPREYHTLRKRWRGSDGYVHSVVLELCPVCYPQPNLLTQEEGAEASGYAILTRAQFLEQRRYEKAGIIPPHRTNNLVNVH